MSIVEHKDIVIPSVAGPMPQPEEPEAPGFFGAFGGGFARSNDVYAAFRYGLTPEFQTDLSFDFPAAAKLSKFYGLYPEAFNNARSAAEFRLIETQVAQEHQWSMAANSNGIGGFLGSLVGAVLSPTTFIPGGAAVRGAKVAKVATTAARVALAAGGATLAQEAVLQSGQRIRTMEESASNVLFAAALGGLIGGAVGKLNSVALNKVMRDMATDPASAAIHVPGVDGPSPEMDGSIGAARVHDIDTMNLGDVKGIAPSLPGLESTIGRLNPVSRGLANAESGTVRNLTASLDSGGLYTEGLTNVGGDVASRAKQWHYLAFDALRERARIMGGNFITRMTSVRNFSEQVAFELRRGDGSGSPDVVAYANYVRTNVYNKLLKEAQSVGLKGFDNITPEFMTKYLNRMYRTNLVVKDHDKLIGILEQHFGEQLRERWAKSVASMERQNAAITQKAELLELPPERALAVKAQLEAEMKQLFDNTPPRVQAAVEELKVLRAQLRGAKEADRALIKEDIKRLTDTYGEEIKAGPRRAAGLRKQISYINRSVGGFTEVQRVSLEQLDTLTNQMDAARDRLVKRAEKILAEMDRWTDDVLDAELNKLEEQVKAAYKTYEKADTRIAKMKELPPEFRELEYSDVRPTEKLSIEEARQADRELRLNQLLDRLEEAKTLDREGARDAVRSVLKDAVVKAERAQFKKAKQAELLRERIKTSDPELARAEAARLRQKARWDMTDFQQKLADNNIKLLGGREVDSSKAATEIANYVANKLMGNTGSIPFLKMMEERGPELMRMLNINETRVFDNGAKLEDFLENDAEYLMRAYVRTMAADIELMRKFGTVSPLAPDSPYLRQINEEFDAARKTARETLTGKKLDKKLQAIQASQAQSMVDLKGMIERVRHLRGIPENAADIGFRAGKFIKNWNVVRLMGNMAVSSIVDLSAVVIKHGFLDTFRDGLIPLMTQFRTARLTMREVQEAGVGLDLMLHGRAAAIYDVLDEIRGGTMAERGMQFASNQMGWITGMDRWNSGMKQFTGLIAVNRLSKDIELAALEGNKKALRHLERLGIDQIDAKNLWKELSTSGDRHGTIMVPNMEDWTNPEYIRVFRGAIARMVDDTIITPGAERPLWMDGSQLGQLLGQFRSFTFSSTQKILWAGAQDARSGEPAVFGGLVFSVALGMLSYYIKETAASPERAEKVRNASMEKMVMEGIKASMLLGVLSEAQRAAAEIPGEVSSAATLGTGPKDNTPFGGPIVGALGPAMGLVSDLDKVIKDVLSGDMSPGGSSALKRLMAYNNVTWLARQFDKVKKEIQQ